MQLVAPTILLFGLNVLDALLTIVWVRAGVATESNNLMSSLLEIGDAPFLLVKIGVGLFTAAVLIMFRHRPLARYGVTVALAVYIGLMGVHLVTGLSALGYVSNTTITHFMELPSQFLALIF